MDQPDRADHHAAIDGLAHIIDSQRRNADSRQRLHFNAGLAIKAAFCGDFQPIIDEVDLNPTWLSPMGWHSGIRSAVFFAPMIPASCATWTTSPFLWPRSRIIASVSGAMVIFPARRRGGGNVLGRNIDHMRVTFTVEMGETCHAVFASSGRGLERMAWVALVTSCCRIRLSPIRKQREPARAIRARSSGC